MKSTWASGLTILLVGALAWAVAPESVPSTQPPGLTALELGDPLEPLSLEPERVASLPPSSPQPELPALPDTIAQARGSAGRAERAYPEGEGSEQVVVVTCRQLLVSDPRKAERLGRLLRAGATLQEAERALGRIDVDEATREYAIDELQPELRAEIETIPIGGWSSVRLWRGRAALFQVVAKEERPRSSLPALGENLDAREQDRIAGLRRPNASGNRAPVQAATADAQPATVVEQATPEYPENVQVSADVSVQVTVGLSDDFVDARVLSSSNSLFDQPALDAAQRSTYRSARRNGIPERGTVTLNFHFVAPGATPPQQDQQHD